MEEVAVCDGMFPRKVLNWVNHWLLPVLEAVLSMKTLLRIFFAPVCLMLILIDTIQASTILWVASDGAGDGDGSQSRPLITLKQAKTALQNQVRKGLSEDIVVRLRGGIYTLDSTLELTPAELGDGRYTVTFSSCPGERAVVSGSVPLPAAWLPKGNNLWVLHLPEARGGSWVFRSLFCSGASLPRAREPNRGFYTLAQVTDERRRLTLKERLPAAWSSLKGVELNSTAHWHFSRQPLMEITGNSLLARRPIGTDVSGSRISENESHSRIWLENALVFADMPGEWFLDSAEGDLYYRTAPGENPNKLAFSAPRLRELIVVRGAAEGVVSKVRFEGLEFVETDWEMPAEGRLGVQAGAWAFDRTHTYSPGAALRFIYSWNVTVQNCKFRDLGDGAVTFEAGTRNGLVDTCSFLRVGSDAIQVGRMPVYTGAGHPLHYDFPNTESFVGDKTIIPSSQEMWETSVRTAPAAPSQITISDSTFIDCGCLDYGSVAICVTYAHHVTIEYNLFHNLPYTAINMGWRWAPGLTNCHSNLIRRNRIEGVMCEACDGAGIYLVGEQPGTRVLENSIAGSGGNYWSHGIYADEFSDHMEIAGNYVTSVMDHAIFMHKNGPDQFVHDNNGESGVTAVTGTSARGTLWMDFSPERSPPNPFLYGPRHHFSPLSTLR